MFITGWLYFRDVNGKLIMDLYVARSIKLPYPFLRGNRSIQRRISRVFREEMPERVHFTIETNPCTNKGTYNLGRGDSHRYMGHYVENHKLIPGCTIQIRFQKKWISGTYQWTGNPADEPELHNKNSSEILTFDFNHQITLKVQNLGSQS